MPYPRFSYEVPEDHLYMKRLLKDPLLHFLLIGAALFLVFGMVKSPAENPENRIVITQGDIDSLKANFARTWRRPPTENELESLIEDQVRDEISYREAVAMGLDQNDRVIRKRLRMKWNGSLKTWPASTRPQKKTSTAFWLKTVLHSAAKHRYPSSMST